jgi:hypothetical protein
MGWDALPTNVLCADGPNDLNVASSVRVGTDDGGCGREQDSIAKKWRWPQKE